MKSPIQPSTCSPVNNSIKAEIKTAAVVITSFKLSCAVALRVSELISPAIFLYIKLCQILITIDNTKIIKTKGESLILLGSRIFSTEEMRN